MELRFLLTIIYKLKIPPTPPNPVGFEFSSVADEQTRELFSPLHVCVCAMCVYIQAHTDRQTLPSQLLIQVFQGKSGRSRQQLYL
jgi:hypothetical protein